MNRAPVTVACPAKVNLVLSVGGRDETTGLHPLSSWMAAVDLCDTLTVRRLPDAEPTRAAIRFAPDAPRPETVDWPIASDLAVRAHRACEAAAGRRLPLAVDLVKRIPTGGGLGGGSSDAAGLLVAVDRLFDRPLPRETQISIAQSLGSDVPFALAALTGTPSAVISGFGETLRPAPTAGGHLVLFVPRFGCDTRRVYQTFDGARGARTDAPEPAARLVAHAAAGDAHAWDNDLCEPARTAHPPLDRLLRAASHHVGRTIHLTGSGSTCFAAADDAAHAATLARRFHGLAQSVAGLRGVAAVPVRYPFTPPAP